MCGAEQRRLGSGAGLTAWSGTVGGMAAKGLRSKVVGAAISGGLALVYDDPRNRREPDAIVVEHRGDEDHDGDVVLYFHPQVPEATLVLLRA
jgi:hypothetical protein